MADQAAENVDALQTPQPGDGKSLLAANLAAALGQIGLRVILVDGKLHHHPPHALRPASGAGAERCW